MSDEPERETSRRFWAATMLALDPDTCASIMRGLPVRVGNLDGFFLRRALRGGQPPDAESYIAITGGMLAAVHEAGPLAAPLRPKGGVRR